MKDANKRGLKRAWFVVALVVLAVLSAQSKPQSDADYLAAKARLFNNYAQDFLDFSKAHTNNIDEYEISLDLLVTAQAVADYLDATSTLLTVYDDISCDSDRVRVRPLIRTQLAAYAAQIGRNISRVNLNLSYTKIQGVAVTAGRMKEDMREVKDKLDSLRASLK